MANEVERRSLVVTGTVQGVGFRPYVFALAHRFGISGVVKNRAGTVVIEAEAERAALNRFVLGLSDSPPPLARIDDIRSHPQAPRGDTDFRIGGSELGEEGEACIAADVAPCSSCIAELFDPADRRYRYPFLNCTGCGPRFTIVEGAPYDRERTTMATFAMCADCRAEYSDTSDRRFHAQPTACPACGPVVRLGDEGEVDVIEGTVRALRTAKIGAIKGLGGFHLACDATSEVAVRELRRRKGRPDKPLALMVETIAQVEELCELSEGERQALQSRERPIVLLRRRPRGRVAPSVAPESTRLGVMLPYTPLHHLLLREMKGLPLVMTSGNRSEEPIAFENEMARARLGDIADFFVFHNRPIRSRVDDSVVEVIDGRTEMRRRARGFAPDPIVLAVALSRPVLAVGTHTDVTFALAKGPNAILSHHLGDLDHIDAYRAYERAIVHYQELFAVHPELLVHDLHPDLASTRYAHERAAREGLELLGVQHHHAHMASCMAENGIEGPVIGVIFDGTGYGTDGAVWGGEFLVGDAVAARRSAHLRYVPLVSGELAIREPWRMGIAHLVDAGESTVAYHQRVDPAKVDAVGRLALGGQNATLTSSAGRLFDAVASMVGLCDAVSYEAQAAIQLQELSETVPSDGVYPFSLGTDAKSGALVVDTRPLVREVAADIGRGESPARVGRRFHDTLAEIIAVVCTSLRRVWGYDEVVLSGGVFQNALLSREASRRLRAGGFLVHRHRLVPPGDGGISLGQLAIAAAIEAERV